MGGRLHYRLGFGHEENHLDAGARFRAPGWRSILHRPQPTEPVASGLAAQWRRDDLDGRNHRVHAGHRGSAGRWWWRRRRWSNGSSSLAAMKERLMIRLFIALFVAALVIIAATPAFAQAP